jgi:predicted ATPase
MNVNRFVVISGCSGGGKSALLIELGRRGYAMLEEPGRRIVKEEVLGAGLALPWVDETAFARRAIEIALADGAAADREAGWVFFDRGLLDAAAALQHLTGEPTLTTLGQAHRYHRRIFLAPPWPEIYVTDSERRHGLNDAVAEYQRLLDVHPSLGYDVTILRKVSMHGRVDFVLVPHVLDFGVDLRIDGSATTETHHDCETSCRKEVHREAQRGATRTAQRVDPEGQTPRPPIGEGTHPAEDRCLRGRRRLE